MIDPMNEAIEAAKCREEFEKWYAIGDTACPSIERSGDGYKLMQAHQSWQTWKAAFRAQNAGAVDVESIKDIAWAFVMEHNKKPVGRREITWALIDELARRGLLKSQEMLK